MSLLGSEYESALKRTRESHEFKTNIVDPLAEEIIGLFRKHGLTANQSTDVLTHAAYKIKSIVDNSKV